MKKLQVIAIFCLLFLTGCTISSEKSISDQKKDSANWSKPRTKLFSSLDYPELSKVEAEKLIREKFDLTIPSFFNQALDQTQKLVKAENQLQYAIKSEAEILTIRGVITEKENGSPNFFGLAEAQFQVNQQKQHVYLTKQSILIQNTASDNALQGESISLFIKRLGEAMELPDLEQVMEQAERKIAQAKKNGPNQLIEIYNDSEQAKKQQQLSHILTISYDENNLVKEIYGLISSER